MTARDPREEHRASTPLELLFDLTFVVAVAQAGVQLHHALGAGQVGHALAAYAIVFFGIWWAWMNFTWFASAYDTDDVPYRVLTLVQMGGVLVLAVGIPAAFDHFDFTTMVVGYVIMRLAMVGQWLRAAHDHQEGRACTLRYAAGVTVVQGCWIGWLWLGGLAGTAGLAMLVAAELAVPPWAELSGGFTSWHPGHITERYGLFTIIVLGEVLAATTAAVAQAVAAGGPSARLLVAATGGLVLVFGLWWSYFKHSTWERRGGSFGMTLVWGYGHYLIFAAVAALGAGLSVVIDSLGHHASVSPVFAAYTVAVPVAVFLVVLGLLTLVSRDEPAIAVVVAAAVLVVLAAPAARLITLPGAVVAIAVLVSLLLAYHLALARRTTPRAEGPMSSPG
ncbi:MAG TPA: low temperature requirement protein A [Acidimicrobiales bacterium]|nr:low temperature requirement protein A [Acidimicrobiales bacterium]